MSDEIITVTEAAELTGYSEGHIRYLVREEKIKGNRVGERMYLIDRASVVKYANRMDALGDSKHAPQK